MNTLITPGLYRQGGADMPAHSPEEFANNANVIILKRAEGAGYNEDIITQFWICNNNGKIYYRSNRVSKLSDASWEEVALKSNLKSTVTNITYETSSTYSDEAEFYEVIKEAISNCASCMKEYQYNAIFVESGSGNFGLIVFYANELYYSGFANGYGGNQTSRGMLAFTSNSYSKIF